MSTASLIQMDGSIIEESTGGAKDKYSTLNSNFFSSGTHWYILSNSKGLSVLVSGSLTIPMVPPVYMISNFFSTFCLNNEILFLQLKQLLRIGGTAVRNVLCLPSENFGQLIAHLHQVGRLVPLAPVGHRRQVGRIGLQQEAFKTHLGQHFRQMRLLVSHHPVDAQVKVRHLQDASCIFHTARKTVKNPRKSRVVVLFKNFKNLRKSFPHMQDHRQSQLRRPAQLQSQGLLLFLLKTLIPVQIHANFTDGQKGSPSQPVLYYCQFLPVVLLN